MLQRVRFSCFLIGTSSRLIQCAEILLKRGHNVLGVMSAEPRVTRWAEETGIRSLGPDGDLLPVLRSEPVDLLFSIDNFAKIPGGALRLARKFAVNFHDAPLPRYAGVNATNWAIMNREKTHGITWHVMAERIDAGDILKAAAVPVLEAETALTLNAKCYERSIQAFEELMSELEEGRLKPLRQNLEDRTYFPRWRRPPAACTIDWGQSAEEIDALVRGLDFGSYPNPLGLAKLYLDDGPIVVKKVQLMPFNSTVPPGTVIEVTTEGIQAATRTRDVFLKELSTLCGERPEPSRLLAASCIGEGSRLPSLTGKRSESISRINSKYCKDESHWVKRLQELENPEIPYARPQLSGREKPQYHRMLLNTDPSAIEAQNDNPWTAGDRLLAALALYIQRISSRSTFDVGFRDAALARELCGEETYFASYVPLRIDVQGDHTFEELCTRFRARTAAQRTHGSYARDLVLRYPGFRVGSGPSGQRMSCAFERTEILPDTAPTCSADLAVIIPDDGMKTAWWYDEAVLDRDAVARMQAQYATLLHEIAECRDRPVSALSVLTEDERQRIEAWNQTRVDYPQDALLHRLFEAQVERTPGAEAVVFEGRSITYEELNQRANRLAHHLQRLGIVPDTLVGVCMERSLEMVVALYGILKAGGSYVPIDPEYPLERVMFMIEDAEVPVLLTQSWVASRLSLQGRKVLCLDTDWPRISREDTLNPPSGVAASNVAYMIYTSGSTGRPKGALNTHRGICNRLLWMQDQFHLTDADTLLQKTPFSFDVSVWELFWPLLNGAKLVVARPGGHRDPAYLIRTMTDHKVTLVHFVPAMLRVFLEEPGVEECRSLRDVICSGEALPIDLQDAFFKRLSTRLYNLYGPTEAAVDVTFWQCESNSTRRIVPIGRPVANTRIHILDQSMQAVPVGVPGELYIGGVQVGRGYHNRPELTAQRFLPDPFGGGEQGSLYRTGDLCRWLEDGTVEYLGRTDFQVKIRGFRVELSEIETVIREHPVVDSCVVMAQESQAGERRLVGYVVWRKGRSVSVDALRSHLRQRLPEYMVPAVFVSLETLPMSPNGKVDRRALPAIADDPLAALSPDQTEPEDEAERKVAEIWEQVLGIPRVGRDSNFFDLGGDSLRLVRARSRLQQAFRKEVAVVDLFSYTTVRALARHLSGRAGDESRLSHVEGQSGTRRAAIARRRQLRQSIGQVFRSDTDEPVARH
jgi:amino acid adenylation domain-containing protein